MKSPENGCFQGFSAVSLEICQTISWNLTFSPDSLLWRGSRERRSGQAARQRRVAQKSPPSDCSREAGKCHEAFFLSTASEKSLSSLFFRSFKPRCRNPGMCFSKPSRVRFSKMLPISLTE